VIDDKIPPSWPEEVRDAALAFRQGHVVDTPPFFYFRSSAHPVWQLILDPEDDGGDAALVELDPTDGPPFGLITSHTCDLVEAGKLMQPWLSVAPVYDYTSRLKPGQERQIEQGRFGHLVRLTAGWLPAGFWVADLRIEVPIEKGWLVGREPRPGFANLSEYQVLALRLGMRRSRPALSDALHAQLVGPLRAWLGDKGAAYQDQVESLRLLIPGDPATAIVGKLVVVTRDQLTPQATEAWAAFEASLIDSAAEQGVTVESFRYGTLDQLTGRDTEASVRLDFDFLSPAGS
jgi:hypothetical protein